MILYISHMPKDYYYSSRTSLLEVGQPTFTYSFINPATPGQEPTDSRKG